MIKNYLRLLGVVTEVFGNEADLKGENYSRSQGFEIATDVSLTEKGTETLPDVTD